ncbi:DUF4340 domain-containing protein [Dokdonella fugitiva]|uniref:Uncharacterized protein DUF4340 n=1 Tax=Dokdonella fugitiva TaxID=328517 RepID=A0A4R2I7U1_9GAMM|nr:DUF4340 domain-containing protein [Dokdonella fugitiva]TCO40411.1 uncharacterized protein DUF4340 [Dokdonella fugitiva]
MNQKTLIGLGIAAIVAIGAAVALNHSNRPQSGQAEASAYLVPELREHINDVTKVIVTGAEGKVAATLERGANDWTLAEKGGYPADTGKLRAFLLKLAEARRVEQKTSNKEKYALLGVEDVAAKDAKGVQVELDGLARPVVLVVGHSDPRGGTYVREAGQPESWLVSTSLTIDRNGADWLRKDLADISATRVASVEITHADGGKVSIAKHAESDANYTLADVPKGREAGSEFTINGLATALAGLRFDDVVAAKDATPPEQALKARYTTFDGVVVDLTAWEKDGKSYAQFAASLDAAQADKGIATAQAKAKADYDAASAAAEAAKKEGKTDEAVPPAKPASVEDPAKDRETRLAALNKDVADLQARFSGWTYVLPAYKYANINKSMSDLLKPLEDKKAAGAKATKPAKAGAAH